MNNDSGEAHAELVARKYMSMALRAGVESFENNTLRSALRDKIVTAIATIGLALLIPDDTWINQLVELVDNFGNSTEFTAVWQEEVLKVARRIPGGDELEKALHEAEAALKG